MRQTAKTLKKLTLELQPERNLLISRDSLTNFYDILSGLKSLTHLKCGFLGESNRNSLFDDNFSKNLLPATMIFPSLIDLNIDLSKSQMQPMGMRFLFSDLFIKLKTLQKVSFCLKGCQIDNQVFKLFKQFGAPYAKSLMSFSLDLHKATNVCERTFAYISQGLASIQSLREACIVIEEQKTGHHSEPNEISAFSPKTLDRMKSTAEYFFLKKFVDKINIHRDLIRNFEIEWGRKWYFDVKIEWFTDQNRKETDFMRFSLRCCIWPVSSFLQINEAILRNCHGLQMLDFRPGDRLPENEDLNKKFMWKDYLRQLVMAKKDRS
jgi:hypothetical protein